MALRFFYVVVTGGTCRFVKEYEEFQNIKSKKW